MTRALTFSLSCRRLPWLAGLSCLALLAAFALPAAASISEDCVAVIYPDIGEPYRKVFTEIAAGVERQAPGRMRAVAVAAGRDAAELQAALRRENVRAVIALGRQGVRTAGGFDALPVVVGAVSTLPDDERWRGISLVPDPALQFNWLKLLAPGVKRVFVVYSPLHSQAVIRLAREAARAHGLELTTLEAHDLAGAVRHYESVFAGADGRRDAVWLAQDPVSAEEATILPLVLRESWNRGVPLFSSSILHVRRGVLFALYPDNEALGRELAVMARAARDETRPGLRPLRHVRIALNTRTASHLALNVDFEQHSFDAVFP